MNIYEKLSKARLMLQQSSLKKSGHNKNLNFFYMELEDFLPRLNEINDELKILPLFNISENGAELTIINTEKPDESITFTSHTAAATLKGGAAPIQELGSQHTYMRRYMFILAYEITEKDTLDPSVGETKPKPKQVEQDDKIDNKKAYVLKQKLGDRESEVLTFYKITKLDDLTIKQWSSVMKSLEKEQK